MNRRAFLLLTDGLRFNLMDRKEVQRLKVELKGQKLEILARDLHEPCTSRAWLEQALFLPPGFVGRLHAQGLVSRDANRLHAESKIYPDDRIVIDLSAFAPPTTLQQLDLKRVSTQSPGAEILFEDPHLLAVQKPAGILIHSERPEEDTLDRRVSIQLGSPFVYHVHRLDRGTSGIVLYAKHALMLRSLDHQLAKHKIRRLYVALVEGNLSPLNGTLNDSIGKDRHHAGRYRVSKGGQPAVTEYHTLFSPLFYGQQKVSLLACQLKTGRTHQIRVHLSSRGCPVVGDVLYGALQPRLSSARQVNHHSAIESTKEAFFLHAHALSFVHPYTGKAHLLTAHWPQAWQPVLELVGDHRLDRKLHHLYKELNGAEVQA
ncbi:RluA family pseudouridine synthase [Alicyclobacillus tolerans]|uniref:RNA pseudouridylate synthase n=1 Tax=Alicyclobacillus tolerans TaxID=90970 RepID=A0ABT9LTM1_9BACL|nr:MULTISPECIES: RluA family pseudouridine synthase [Alicyclobacillus]MDP9727606.1 23S rRNA pseudouridine1911/1915/1917 synthase [Alicyclobacillus tengchongensis]